MTASMTPLDQWIRAAGTWAQFVKPSLLVNATDEVIPIEPEPMATPWLPSGTNTAVLAELPAQESISLGVALGKLGWCVVPLFNTTPGEREVIPTGPLIQSLAGAAAQLPKAPVGPPVFLSTFERHRTWPLPQDGQYDNQWYLFASDLPSGALFEERGIERLLIVTQFSQVPLARDLQDALAGRPGLELALCELDSSQLHPVTLKRGRVVRALASFGRALQQNPDGSFGRMVSHG